MDRIRLNWPAGRGTNKWNDLTWRRWRIIIKDSSIELERRVIPAEIHFASIRKWPIGGLFICENLNWANLGFDAIMSQIAVGLVFKITSARKEGYVGYVGGSTMGLYYKYKYKYCFIVIVKDRSLDHYLIFIAVESTWSPIDCAACTPDWPCNRIKWAIRHRVVPRPCSLD